MSISDWITKLFSPPAEKRTSFEDLARMFSLGNTYSGKRVSDEGALQQVTVFACVRLIAESIGMLPLKLYKRIPGGKQPATEHPLYSLLHESPNPYLTPIELYENVGGHLAMWGNAYCEIEYDGAGHRRAVWPLRPDRMSVEFDEDKTPYYVYELPNGEKRALERWRVWHVRGWGTDAFVGKSPIALARESIGLTMATEEYGGRFFGNDSRPGGILRHPAKLSPEAAKRLKTSWENANGGLSNKHRVAVLEEGIEWQQIGISPEEAQFLDTRKFQELEICQVYRVPPHMIGITDRSTSWGTGIEEMGIGFVTFTLLPYLTRIAQSVNRDLLGISERRDYFAEHLTAALERGDLMTRYNAYNVGRNGGWLSANDIREMENMNPIEGGDVYLQPMNMAPAGSEPGGEEEPDEEVNDEQ